MNAESGYATCDDNGCGTFLRLSKFPYENAIEDVTHHLEVREREFAVLDITGNPQLPELPDASAVLAPGEGVKKLEDGFFSISGAVDAEGKLYFVDHRNQRIYSLVGERRPPYRTRQSARSRQSRVRQIGQPAGALLRRPGKHGLHVPPGNSAEELTVLTPAGLPSLTPMPPSFFP